VRGSLRIERTFYRIARRQVTEAPKTSSSIRVIDLTKAPGLVEVLLQHKTQGTGTGLVFCQPNGNPLHAHNVTQRDFKRVCLRAGVRRIRFHDLRHVFATHAYGEGADVKDLQAILGHANARQTLETYAHPVPQSQRAVMARMDALLGSGVPAPRV
jgi:integrase